MKDRETPGTPRSIVPSRKFCVTYDPGGAADNEGVRAGDAPLLARGKRSHQGDPSPGFPSSQAEDQLS